MRAHREPCQAAVPSLEQQGASDLAKRIAKLRWLGMLEEAERLHIMLRRVPDTDCVIVIPRDTD